MNNRSSQRISLTLSEEAFAIIKNDMDIFQNEQNLDGFINRVISNYREDSDASISLVVDREKDKYLNRLKKACISETEEAIIDKLVEGYAKELTAKMNSFPNGITLKPRINNDNYDTLNMGTPDFQEDKYYVREGKYVKALIEDYAGLSFYDREGVYFKDIIDDINAAIRGSNIIKISFLNRKQEKKTSVIRPYKIVPSSLLRYHYLLALSADKKYQRSITVLRISRIESVRKMSRTSHITKEEQKYIDEQIRTKGIQYLTTETNNIEVQLTQQGMKLYSSILYLRPKAIKTEKNGDKYTLTFDCADEQIRNYFFQFGKEAVVTSPEELNRWFKTRYKEATSSYDD